MTGANLRGLLGTATPGPWEHRVWGYGEEEWPDSRVSVARATRHGEAIVINPRYGERTQDLLNARLIALCPETVSLLADMADYIERMEKHWGGAIAGSRDLLERFRVLDEKAALADPRALTYGNPPS